MGMITSIFVLLGFGGFLTLFSTCYFGGDPWFVAPLSALMVALTWIAHDLIHYFGRSNSKVRLILTWAYTGRMKQRLRELGALIIMMQLWSLVSIVPALLSWYLCNRFSQYVQPCSFMQCFMSCLFMEMFFSLLLDYPAGFVGTIRRVRNNE